MTAVKCGKAHGYHASTADVRKCYNGEDVPLVQIEQTDGPRCSGDQIRSTKKLLARHGLATSKPVESYGRREISPLMDYLYNNKPGTLSARDLRHFGLVQDGASLAPGQPANYTDQKAREGYVQVPGLDNVWAPENGRSIFDDVDEVDASPAAIQRHIRSTKPQQRRFDSQTPEDGFYVYDKIVYKVIVAHHGSGRKYAKRLLSNGKWETARGAITRLRPEHKMTLKQALATAKVYATDVDGELYGRCFVCGRTLTDEESIKANIGPVCAGKFA